MMLFLFNCTHFFFLIEWILFFFPFHFAQDEYVLDPELYERAEKLFRVLLNYVTKFLVWEESFELSAELQPRYGPSSQTPKKNPHPKRLILSLTQCFLTRTGLKRARITVCSTTMSTTRTTMWSTPCSVRLTVIKLRRRHTQLSLIRRYFSRLYACELLFK